jgi:hypothetical protein
MRPLHGNAHGSPRGKEENWSALRSESPTSIPPFDVRFPSIEVSRKGGPSNARRFRRNAVSQAARVTLSVLESCSSGNQLPSTVDGA